MTKGVAVIDHTARAHSTVVGGSSAGRVLQCPGSVQLCAQYPNIETEFAAEGTALHMALDMIMSGLAKEDRDVIGLTFNGYVITEEMFEEALRPILDKWDELDQELGGISFLSEQRVAFPGIEGAFGTTDLIGVAKDRTIVADAKFGRGVAVTAEKNPQEFYYARAAMNTPATAKFFDEDRPVEFIIFQPRVNDGEPFTRWMTTTKQLLAFEVELRTAVETAMLPDAPLKMGPYCKFCSAKSGCPLYQNLARNARLIGHDDMKEHLEEWLPQADMLIELGNFIKSLAHDQMEKGMTVKGWKLVNKRATRNWADEEKAVRYMAKVGLPAADRHVKKLISPAQAEKALKAAGLPDELPKALVESRSSGTTLAPESDKRPAVVVGATALKMLADRLAAR
jgi:Protein of unknown function (DUF2800)